MAQKISLAISLTAFEDWLVGLPAGLVTWDTGVLWDGVEYWF